MDIELSEEERMLQEKAYSFAVREFEPLAKECDREEKYPRDLVGKACDEGFVGCFFPEKYGGSDYGFLKLALLREQFCRVDMGLDLVIMTTTFGSENILLFGREEQKEKYLPALARGKAISSGAYTEPDAGSDVAGIKTSAVKRGDEYLINGSKIFTTNGTICDFMIALCVTNPEREKKHKRQSLILIEADREGVSRSKIKGKMGVRASDTAEIFLDDVRVPCENLVGEEGEGFYHLMHFFDVTRTSVAAQGVGLAQGALEKTLRYVRERHSFGKPIASDQSIQFKLAEMATKIELARNITYKAAAKVDKGQTDPALNAMAKYFSGETAVEVCNTAVALHGSYGCLDEYDVQRYYRHAKVLEIYEGAKEAEKVTIARRILRS